MGEVLQNPEVAEDSLNLKQLVRILQRRWQVVVGVLILAIIATLGYLRTAPRIYEATSLLRIQPSNQTLALVGLPVSAAPQPKVDLKTIERLVTTRMTVQEAVRILKGQKLEAMERLIKTHSASQDTLEIARNSELEKLAVEKIMGIVKTRTLDPDLIEIRVRHSDPELAALITNSLAEAMVRRFKREAQREASQERLYIERSLKILEKQLRNLEAQIAKEKKRLGIVDISEETKRLLTSLQTYELEQHDAQAQRDAAEAEIERLRQQIEREQPIVSVDVLKEDPVLKQTREQLAALELERAKLLALFTSEHPEVQQVEERIKTLRETLARQSRQLVKEREITPNPAYQLLYQQLVTAEANRFAAEARLRALNRFLPELKKRLEALPENQRRLEALLRKSQATEQIYTNLLMRLEEARIRETSKTGDLVIADLATPPQRPVSPRPLFSLAIALVLGFMLGVMAALVLEGLNETVTTDDEVQEQFGVPVLANIPKTRSDLTHEHVLDLMASRRFTAEAVRSLRANLKFLSREKSLKIMLITSTAPGEGKTFLATSLAIAWAQSGHTTVLVDFDFRLPQVHECMGLNNEKGLSNFLVGTATLEEVLQQTPLKYLQVITSGPIPPNPAELLDSEGISKLVESLRERFEIAIWDTPPILAVSDTALLVPHVDGVIAVAVPGQTLRPALRQLKKQIEMAQGRLIGIVFNKVTPTHGGYYYGSYYRYYRYYRDYGEPE